MSHSTSLCLLVLTRRGREPRVAMSPCFPREAENLDFFRDPLAFKCRQVMRSFRASPPDRGPAAACGPCRRVGGPAGLLAVVLTMALSCPHGPSQHLTSRPPWKITCNSVCTSPRSCWKT